MVLAITPSGMVTARATDAHAPTEGTNVVDAHGRLRGRVQRVVGPVARPYLSIRPRRPPTPAEAAAIIGTPLRREPEG